MAKFRIVKTVVKALPMPPIIYSGNCNHITDAKYNHMCTKSLYKSEGASKHFCGVHTPLYVMRYEYHVEQKHLLKWKAMTKPVADLKFAEAEMLQLSEPSSRVVSTWITGDEGLIEIEIPLTVRELLRIRSSTG